ncbi:MAG: hypothetical protein QM749_19310 [Aquabacterium sp.]
MRRDEIRLERHGPLVVGHGLRQLPAGLQGIAQVAVGFDIVRQQLDRFLQGLHAILALRHQDGAQDLPDEADVGWITVSRRVRVSSSM